MKSKKKQYNTLEIIKVCYLNYLAAFDICSQCAASRSAGRRLSLRQNEGRKCEAFAGIRAFHASPSVSVHCSPLMIIGGRAESPCLKGKVELTVFLKH